MKTRKQEVEKSRLLMVLSCCASLRLNSCLERSFLNIYDVGLYGPVNFAKNTINLDKCERIALEKYSTNRKILY